MPEDPLCPCCGDNPMNPANVVCWPCYRATNRLQEGTWAIEQAAQTVSLNVTAAYIALWTRLRDERKAHATHTPD